MAENIVSPVWTIFIIRIKTDLRRFLTSEDNGVLRGRSVLSIEVSGDGDHQSTGYDLILKVGSSESREKTELRCPFV